MGFRSGDPPLGLTNPERVLQLSGDSRKQPAVKTERVCQTFTVRPDSSKPILSVEVYYTQQGPAAGEIEDRDNRINRFWQLRAFQGRG